MKRIWSILSSFLVIGVILFILIDFRRVETLSAEEKQAIDRYRQELVKGTLLSRKQHDGIFYQQDFEAIAQSLDALHQHDHYYVFGPAWGEKLANPRREFAKVEAILRKPVYANDTRHRDFFQALWQDLGIAKKKLNTRESHDILDDLSTLVFTKEIGEQKQWSHSKTLQVMKEQGLQLIKEDAESTSPTPSGQQQKP
jgi:hypothetical protein